MRLLALLASSIVLFGSALITEAQSAAAPSPPNSTNSAPIPAAAGIPPLLNQIDQNSQATLSDLAHLRIDKWKTESSAKQQAQSNVESVERNLTNALPGMVQQVRANPSDVSSGLKLYRNLNALYDVLSSLAESVGAFGPKDEYRSVAEDVGNLDNLRRSFADQLQTLAQSKEEMLTRLQTQMQAQAAAAAPPKKIVVDENAPATTTRKKTAKKKTTPPAAAQPQ